MHQTWGVFPPNTFTNVYQKITSNKKVIVAQYLGMTVWCVTSRVLVSLCPQLAVCLRGAHIYRGPAGAGTAPGLTAHPVLVDYRWVPLALATLQRYSLFK